MKLKTVTSTIRVGSIKEDILEFLENLDIEVKDDVVNDMLKTRLLDGEENGDTFIDFIVEDVVTNYLSTLNLKSGVDYDYSIFNEDESSDSTVISLTLVVRKKRVFHVYAWSHTTMIVGGEGADTEVSGAYVILEDNLVANSKKEALEYVSKKYNLLKRDLIADEVLVD